MRCGEGSRALMPLGYGGGAALEAWCPGKQFLDAMKHATSSLRLLVAAVLFGMGSLYLQAQSQSATKFHSRKAGGGEPGIGFGLGVAMNERWIAVSEPAFKMGMSYVGAVHVFDAVTGRHRRVIVDPLAPSATQFGSSLALEGDLLLVGAYEAGSAGRAYLYNVRTGALMRTLLAPSANNNGFGFGGMDMEGSRAVIADWQYSHSGNLTGAVFVYDDVAVTTTPTLIVPADAADGDQFGTSVSLCGNLLLVGANKHNSDAGAAYLFDVKTGALLRKFIGAAGDQAGVSVALEGGRAAVGAPGSNINGAKSGLVRVYNAETGFMIFLLEPEDAGQDQFFGYSLAATPDLIVVGAPGHAIAGGGENAGASYAFDARAGGQIQRLLAPGRQKQDWCAFRVAVWRQKVLMGAFRVVDPTDGTGYATLFNPVAGRLPQTLLGRQGDAAADVAQARHAGFGDAVLSQTGRAAFTSTLNGTGAAGGKNRGAFCSLLYPDSVEALVQSGLMLDGGRRVTSMGQPLVSEKPVVYFQCQFQGAGGGRMLVAGENGMAGLQLTPLLVEGSIPGWSGDKRLARLGQVVAPSDGTGDVALIGQYRQGIDGVTAADDSLLASLATFGGPNSVLQEGTVLGGGGRLGQLRRAAMASDRVVCHAGIQDQANADQGIFLVDPMTGDLTEIARQGQIPGILFGTTYRTFLGETIAPDQWVLYRFAIAGSGVTAANREVIRMVKLLTGSAQVARTGDQVPGLPAEVVWSRFLHYWIVNNNQALILGRVRGPGVNAGNDLVLWLRQEDGSARVLLREGDLVPGMDGARVGVIQRVTGENKSGAYSVLISLRGAPASRNQMLLTGRTGITTLGLGALRQPFPRLIKGSLHQMENGQPLRVASLGWGASIVDATGAGAKGLGQVINPNGLMVLKVRMSDGRAALFSGRP